MSSAAARLFASMSAPDTTDTTPDPEVGGAAARLFKTLNASAPAETVAQTPAAVAQTQQVSPEQFNITRYLSGLHADWDERRRSEDIQRIVTPLERTLEGITASGRGLAKMGDELASGRNPFWSGQDHTIPFAEGAADPHFGWGQVLKNHVPDFTAGLPPTYIPGLGMTPAGTVSRDQVVGPAGLAMDVGFDPATYLGLGAVTRAGKAMRAGETGLEAAGLALKAARNYDEAAAAVQRWNAARDLLDPAAEAARAEGTAATKGRALISVAGRTNPMLAAGPVVQGVSDVVRTAQMTRLGRGLSTLMQPVEKTLPDAVRAGGMRADASGSVGRREALRALVPEIKEFPDIVKAVGDQGVAEDALSLAVERSQGKRFDNPLDWLTQKERDRFWQTQSADVKAQLEAAGRQRADAGVLQFANKPERQLLRVSRTTLAQEGPLRAQLTAPVEYSEQLAQKNLSTRERSELQRLMARRAKRENAAMASVNEREGVGIGRPLPAPGDAPIAPFPKEPVAANLANPIEEARIGQLQDLATQREAASRATSLEKLNEATSGARVMVDRITQKAQLRTHAQALQNSVTMATRMYLRGAAPGAQSKFGRFATQLAQKVNARNATMFSQVAAAGVPISELADPLAYMLHATTDEGKKAMVEAAVDRGALAANSTWSDFLQLKDTGDMTRKLRMTATEANDLAAQGKLSITGGRRVEKFFHTNPLIAQVMRETAASGSMGGARHLRELAVTFGTPAKAAPRGWRVVPNEIVGIGDQVAFTPDIAEHLTKHYWALRDPWRMTQAWDRAQQVWKAWTLGVFPVYHTRNELGDLWNGVVLGGMNPKYIGPAMDDLMHGSALAQHIGRSGRPVTLKGIGTFRPGQLRDEFEALGGIQSGQLQQEIEHNVLGALHQRGSIRQAVSEAGAEEKGARRLGSKIGAGLNMVQQKLTDNRVIGAAMAIGNMREQAFRLASYIDRRAAGWSPEASAIWANKHLIDYGQMSNAEIEGGRRLFPFYSWTRHNVPLQLEYLFAKPGAFGGVQHLREAAAGDRPLGLAGAPMPSFLAEHLPIRTGENDEGSPEFWRLEGTWPGADVGVAMSPGAAIDRVTNLISPGLKEPGEQIANVDLFRSSSRGHPVPIERTPGERGSFLGASMPQRAIHALRNVRLLTELDRANPGNVFGTDTERAFGGLGPVRDFPQVSGGQRLGNVFLGRGYAVDEGKNYADWTRAWNQALAQLDSSIRLAQSRGQTEKAAQMQMLRDRLQEHPEMIRPDQQR